MATFGDEFLMQRIYLIRILIFHRIKKHQFGSRPTVVDDIAFSGRCRYAHVQSGVTPAGAVVEPTPDIEVTDLAAVADVLLAAEG